MKAHAPGEKLRHLYLSVIARLAQKIAESETSYYYTCLLLLCSTSFKLEGKSDGNKKYREKLRNENCAIKCCHLAQQLFVSIIIVSHRPAKTKISLAIATAIDYTRYPSLYYYGKNTRRTQEYLVYINDLPKAPPLSDREYNHGFDSDLSI